MSDPSVAVHSPAPDPEGPVACSLSPDELGGRLADFREDVFAHLRGMERSGPTRLRLVLSGEASQGTVRELLVSEQRCCAFLAFTITPEDGWLLVDLVVPAHAAAVLDGLAQLAERAAPGAARATGEGG